MSETPAARCRALVKVYGADSVQVRALDGVDLDVAPGEFMCLSGPSGSGKTTLLNMLGGLDRPTSGSVEVGGRRLEGMGKGELARMRLLHLGFVFQAYNLIPVLSAAENVEFVMQLQGVEAGERSRRVSELLDEVGLAGLGERRPGELSGGQQQRVAVARAIASGPSLVLADEPTANLDSKTAESLMTLLRGMNEKRGVTFVFSTHDRLVMDYSRRLVTMRDGRVAGDDRRD